MNEAEWEAYRQKFGIAGPPPPTAPNVINAAPVEIVGDPSELQRVNKGRGLWGAPPLAEIPTAPAAASGTSTYGSSNGAPLFQVPPLPWNAPTVNQAPQLEQPQVAAPAAAPMPQPMQQGGPMQLSYPPVRNVAAAWQNKGRVTEGAHEVPEEAKADIMGGLDKQEGAAASRGLNEAQYREREMALFDLEADRAKSEAIDANARAAGRKAKLDEATAKFNDLTQRAAEQGDVDPNKFFGDRGAGVGFLAAIGVALGQASASLGGGPNAALQIVEGALDRSLQAQKMQLDETRGQRTEQKGVLAEMRANFADEREADLAAKDAMLGAAELRLKALGSEAQSNEAKARANEMIGAIQEKRGAVRQQWSALADGNIKLSEQYIPAHTVGGPPRATPASKEADERLVTLDDGTTYQARSAEDAKKIRAQLAGTRQIESLARDLDKTRDKTSTYIPGTKSAADAESLGAQMLYAFKDTEQAGTVDKGLIESFEKLVGDPRGITSRSGQRALNYAERKREAIISALKANGARVVQEGYATDQNGNVVPTQKYAGQSVANALTPKTFQPAGGGEAPKDPKMPALKTFDPAATQIQLEKRRTAKK
jgi:hypothetical protein